MKKSRLLGAVCGYASIFVVAAWSMPTTASIVYDFTGDCTSVCTGQGTAMLTLTDDFIPGNPFSISQFVSMTYVSSSIEYSFSASEILTLYASLMPIESGPGNVNIDWLQDETGFISNATEWKSSCGSVALCTVSNGALVDTGSIGTWTLRTSPVPIPVTIDIKPSKKPGNVISLKKDKNLKVAIVGSATFDALQVNPDTVQFGPSGASPAHNKGQDYNHDGFSDLVLTFKLNETGIACGDESAMLTGQTFPEPVTDITGSDSFTVEPCP